MNILFNSADRIILGEEFADVSLDSIKKNICGPWWWDIDGFATNQFGHPYQGSLYYNAGRANGLSFWQSFLIAGFGSLTWEEFGETDAPSLNDIITTPICGAVFGEVMHRLYLDAAEAVPALAWLISPMDALNHALTGKTPVVDGHTEEVELIFHMGIEQSNVDFYGTKEAESMLKSAAGNAIHIQYGNECGHTTKESFDSFTLDLDTAFSRGFYKIDFDIDGFLWSHGFNYGNNAGTFGLNLLYEGEYADNAVFSNAASGLKFIFENKNPDFGRTFKFFVQLDGIFLGTRSNYELYGRRNDYESWENPPRCKIVRKTERYKIESDTTQTMSSIQLYGKWKTEN